eukprot:gene9211-10171_t
MGKLEIRCNTARTSYAVIPVAISSAIPLSSNRDVSFDDDEDYDSLNISSEACCLPPCREVIEGELTIALQPTYLVPCPYLRLWKQNGEMVTLEALQMLLARFSTSSQSLSEVVDDSRRYQWGQWLPEVHPVLDQSCLGLHACDVSSHMEMILQDSLIERDSLSPNLYILIWLGWVSRLMGIEVCAGRYKELYSSLKSNLKGLPC